MMAFDWQQRPCKRCGVVTWWRRQRVNHALHLGLSIVTGGLWVIVWAFVQMTAGGWQCQQCQGRGR